MRLWSLHPQYLDPRGLVALWREGLLAQAVLRGRTRGYRNHPQLTRFRRCPSPVGTVAAYLRVVQAEALAREYRFDAAKISRAKAHSPLTVTRGQLRFEWEHLLAKVQRRDPQWGVELTEVRRPRPHPLFRVLPGEVEDWERGAGNLR